MTIRELGGLLRARKISCAELIDQTFAAIRQRETFNSFITLTEESARAQAVELDRDFSSGRDRGPLHGIPIAHKDLFCTRGIPTTAGSLVFRDFIPDRDATVVERLRAAGAISVGKTNLHELAYGITSKNPHYGFVLNPRDITRVAGGSSGGSAALVAGNFLPLCTGTDTGGSIRIPASFCGIAGLKPTYGRVSRHGVLPLAFSLDHVGPLASCVEDCALAMDAMAGPDSFDLPELPTLAGVRVGVPQNFFFDHIHPEIAAAVSNAISSMEQHGASLVELRVPDMAEAYTVARIVQLAETASLYARYTDQTLFGADVWRLIQQGKSIAGHEYVSAQRIRTLFRRQFDELWTKVDVLATPTTPMAAPLLDEETIVIDGQREDTRAAATRFVRGINFIGEPALSLPCGTTTAGLPIGLQLIAPPFAEPRLLQIANRVEAFLA
ncbi:MAG TPA: amidase [Bryobacteraceae bacterium]|jgi:aspartyl-tRNA(Asn)/glutamyl-tRNA(Gln) amidotransferase subunit A|nr:amidase [Bryobacteraceae bacterium]